VSHPDETAVVVVRWSPANGWWAAEALGSSSVWCGHSPFEAALAAVLDLGLEAPVSIVLYDKWGKRRWFDPSARRDCSSLAVFDPDR
jgi:hypothetical protein